MAKLEKAQEIESCCGEPYKCWKAWWPEEGETEKDAIDFPANLWPGHDPEIMAEASADYDFHSRDGFNRDGDGEQIIIVKSPDGEESKFRVVRDLLPSFRVFEAED
jgi:hypothetical protein